MKMKKSISLLMLFAMSILASVAQSENRLYLQDIRANKGHSVMLPVYLENSSQDIVALQFDLHVDDRDICMSTGSTELSAVRCEDHVLNVTYQGNGNYTFMLHSPTNTPLKASAGEIFSLPVQISESIEEKDYALTLSHVVLSDSKGVNVATGSGNASLIVKPTPDFEISDIQVAAKEYAPDDKMKVSWKVANVGNAPSTGGWTERVYFVSATDEQVCLGTCYYNITSLEKGKTVNRQEEVLIPMALGFDGSVDVMVELIPNNDSGESYGMQGNNIASTTGQPITVGHRLFLTVPATVNEGIGEVRCELTRSGNRQSGYAFRLEKKGDNRLEIPQTVLIPTGQSSAFFYIDIKDNSKLDTDSVFTITVTGDNYSPESARLVITDNDSPDLTIKSSKQEITEGETFQLTVSVSETLHTAPITVNLTSENNKRFSFPKQAVIPTGQSSVSIAVQAIDNDEIEQQESVAFYASAEAFENSECIVLLNDNDMPTMTFTLSPSAVSESEGATALLGIIKRTDKLDKRVTFKFTDDSGGLLDYSTNTIVLEKNRSEVQFNIGVTDNNVVDGSRNVNVTASIYSSSCNCAIQNQSGAMLTAVVTIVDDDGPSLSIKPAGTSMLEGSKGNRLTISHKAAAANHDIKVRVSSDMDERLSYSHEVVIPAGVTSTDLLVDVKNNAQDDDSGIVTFKAEADGYALGSCWILVTDQSLPDAVVSVQASKQETEAEDVVELKVIVKNIGNGTLMAGIPVKLAFSGREKTVTLTTTQDVASGESTVIDYNYDLPAITGTHYFTATVNPQNTLPELIYANNTSAQVPVTLLPRFSATATTDKKTYKQGESVTITGTATGSDGQNANVEIFLINEDARQTIISKTDAEGNFTATWQPSAMQSGHFVIGACYPGSGNSQGSDAFDIYGLSTTSNYGTYELANGETYSGKLTVSNPGVLAQSGLKVEPQGTSENCTFDFNAPGSIDTGKTIELPFTIKGNAVSNGRDWQQMPVKITTTEGACLDYKFYYFVYPQKARLEVSETDINTTMTLGSPRDYSIVVRNTGKAETGKITLALPEWITTVTPREMGSLSKGDSATIMLRFMPTEQMKLNVSVTGKIGINCANGDGAEVGYVITPVSDKTGRLTIDVVDEYTFYTDEAPHVSDAKVEVVNPSTNETVAKGETNSNGIFTTEIPEGYYTVKVEAEKHDGYQGQLLVSPGTEKRQEVFLPYQAVTYSWDVKETEVEDEYEIETVVKFETRVPKPVVILELPEKAPEPNSVFPVVLTNEGLVHALDVDISVSANDSYKLEYLNNVHLDTLPARSSYVLYAKLRQDNANASRKRADSSDNSCFYLSAEELHLNPCPKYPTRESGRASKQYGTCPPGLDIFSTNDSKSEGDTGPGYPSGWGGFKIYDHGGDWNQDFNTTTPTKVCSSPHNPNDPNNPNAPNDPINRDTVPDKAPNKMNCDSKEEPVLVYRLVPVEGTRYVMNGVAADGISKVKIVLDPEKSTIPPEDCENFYDFEWRLSDKKLGKIVGNSFEGAIYTAPDTFPSTYGRFASVEATLYYTQRTSASTTFGRKSSPVKIEIIRPPVVIVHGLLDKEKDWRKLEESLSPDDYESIRYIKEAVYRVDYSKTKSHSLYENYPVIGNGIHKVQRRVLAGGYVATKCDIVGFGQGGLLARLYVQNGGDREEINRIITANTSHSGSEVADAIIGHKIVFGNLLRLFLWDTNIQAIEDLGVNSSTIEAINAQGGLTLYNGIPVHATGTQNGLASGLTTAGLGTILNITGDITKGIGPIGAAVAVIAKYLGHFLADDCSQVGMGDLLVSTESQIGGCEANTITDWGYSHWDVPKSYNSNIMKLLIEPEAEFSETWFNPPVRYFDHENWLLKLLIGEGLGVVGGKLSEGIAEGVLGADHTVKIAGKELTSKDYGAAVFDVGSAGLSFVNGAATYVNTDPSHARASKSVSSAPSGERRLLMEMKHLEDFDDPMVIVSCGEDEFSMAEGYDVELKMPSTYSGEVKVIVFMKRRDGNIQYEGFTFTIDDVIAKPVSLVLEETTLNTNEGEFLRLYCTWDDGSETKVIADNVTFDTPNVAKFEDGQIVGLNQGFTKVTASYKGLISESVVRVFAKDGSSSDKDDDDNSDAVCTTVSLSFKQQSVMTRQAFRGTLTVNNGHEALKLKDLKVNVEVRGKDGRIATAHEFQIDAESIDGFEGDLALDAGWTLAASSKGIATILFIPTKYAATTEPKDYAFGGSFSYTDPATDLTVTRNLNPVTLTVNPSPNLDLTYFMQRDVFGDDPLTEKVEPMQPAEFALLINNKGYGDAQNMSLTTQQPQIIDNEKGLAVNFELLSSQLNGQEKTLALGGNMTTDFGMIPAHSQAYAQWWLQSSLLGHFVEYDVKATHVTSRDNPDLSLLDNVTIHELTHGFTVDDKTRGFLVNDIKDAEDLPDAVYFTDATRQDVAVAANISLTRQSDTDYLLTVIPSGKGWNYGSLVDPTGGVMKVESAVRMSDGRQLGVDNVWQTDRTLRDGHDPLMENRLHFVGEMSDAGESYLLTFTEKSDVEVAIRDIEIIPGKDATNPLNIIISPIPVYDQMHISGDFKEIRQVVVYDMGGGVRLRMGQILLGQAIDVSRLPTGIYVVGVKTERGNYQTKIIKK